MNSTTYNFLKTKFSNEYAIFGIMANLYAESALISSNVENGRGYTDNEYIEKVLPYRELFTSDRIGWGIAQWTHPKRKELLYNFCEENVDNLCSLQKQLEFLWWEMCYYYPKVIEQLKICTSLREATKIVLKQYEQPRDQTEENIDRRTFYADEFYRTFSSQREYITHQVRAGDTLNSISRLYRISVKDIREFNDIDNMVYPHTIVKIPVTNTEKEHEYFIHIVSKGETLWELAKRFYGSGTDYKTIKVYNKLESDTIYAEQQIKIPIKKKHNTTS